jgi:hypothetical protein
LVRDVPIQESLSGVEAISVEVALPEPSAFAASPESLLTKFRLVLDGSGPGIGATVVEALRESRIRLLSRY